jgi:hypothetical protein
VRFGSMSSRIQSWRIPLEVERRVGGGLAKRFCVSKAK